MPTIYHISGFRLAQARKVCKFFFGDFYKSCELNQNERIFEINLNKSLKVKQRNGIFKDEPIEDYIEIENFKKFWGPQWKIMYYVTTEEV